MMRTKKQKQTDTIDDYFEAGKAHDKAKEYEQAIDCYREVLSRDSNNVSTLFAIGGTLSALKRWDEALVYYDRILGCRSQPPTFPSLSPLKCLVDSVAWHNEIIQFDKRGSQAFYRKGLVLCELNFLEAAIFHYEQSLLIEPNDIYVLFHAALASYDFGYYEDAVTYYDQIIEHHPKLSNVFMNKGLALNELEKYKEAIQVYNKAIALGEKRAEIFYYRGLAEYQVPDYEAAIKSYDLALALSPDFEDAVSAKFNLLMTTGRIEGAIQWCTERGITSFSFRECPHIVRYSVDALGEILLFLSESSITSLDLSSLALWQRSFANLAKLFKCLSENITTLDLRHNFLSTIAHQVSSTSAYFGARLVEVLKNNHALTSIDLSNNNLSVDAIEAVETYIRQNLEAQLKATFCKVDEATGEENWAWFRFEAYLNDLSQDCQQFQLARSFFFAALSGLVKIYGFLLYRNLIDSSIPEEAVRLYYLLLEVGSQHKSTEIDRKDHDATALRFQFDRVEKSEALLKKTQPKRYRRALLALAAQEFNHLVGWPSVLIKGKRAINGAELKTQFMKLLLRMETKGWTELKSFFLAIKTLPYHDKDALIRGITMLFEEANKNSAFHIMLALLLDGKQAKGIKKRIRKILKKSEADYLANEHGDKHLSRDDKAKVKSFVAIIFNSSAIETLYLLSKPPELPKKFLPYLPNKILSISVLSELVEFSADKQEGDFARFFGSSSQKEQSSEQVLLTS